MLTFNSPWDMMMEREMLGRLPDQIKEPLKNPS
jgi:hypothetical protein